MVRVDDQYGARLYYWWSVVPHVVSAIEGQ